MRAIILSMWPQFARRKGSSPSTTAKPPRAIWKWLRYLSLMFVILVIAGRLAMPTAVTWYVNRVINQSPAFRGKIGSINIHLWRGAYTINEIRIIKVTGNVPVPLFAAKQLDLTVQWNALVHGRLVGQININQPELNFVDAPDSSSAQTGGGGPWLGMLRDLFPFKINSCNINGGSVHFRAYQTKEPFDIYLSNLTATIDNLSNVKDSLAPLQSTVTAHASAMDQAQLDLTMKLNPNSYRPNFQLAMTMIGLDVTKVNQLTRSYGSFDFEKGWFDLVVELNARGGGVDGYIKPLFRNLQIFGKQDLKEDNVLGAFWEALLGISSKVLTNPPRDQFGTVIPLHGDLTGTKPDILPTVGNLLRNAFIRAYLPKFQGGPPEMDGLRFGTGTDTVPTAAGEE